VSLDLRLVAHAPNGARQGVLPTPQTVSASMVFGDVGGVEVAYPPAGPKGSLLASPCEIAVEVSYDLGATWTEPDNARYLRLVRAGDTVEQVPVVAYRGPSYLWTLSKARVLPEGLLNADGKRPFLTATPGTILRTLIQEAQARGALAGLDAASFTNALDSSGAAWAQAITIYYEPGLDYLTILMNLQAQGLIDFTMTGRTLKVYNADTVMAGAATGILQKGRDLTEAPYTGTLEGLANYVYLQGDEGASFSRTNGAALAPWGRWETFISQGGVKDTGTMTVLSDSALELSAAERVENTYGLNFALATALPFRDYGLGKDVRIRDTAGLPTSLRCRQITLTRDERGTVAGNVVLNDRFLENEVRQTRRVQGITGGSTADGGTGARPAPTGTDRMPPKAPTGLLFASDSYLDDEGKVWATITTTWVEPTQNQDGTALTDLAGYEVFWRLTGDTTWTLATSVDAPASSATIGGYFPATGYEVAVKAYDETGNRSGLSVAGGLVTDDDATAPVKPSTPVVSALLGQILATWDGLGTGGAALPTDFARLEFHASNVSGFAPSAATLVDQSTARQGGMSTVITGFAYDQPVYVRLVMYDRSGNVSPVSDEASATPRRLVEFDLGNGLRESVQAVWSDSFSTPGPPKWQVESGAGSIAIVETADSTSGDGVLEASGPDAWIIPTMPMIPFDPDLLYRMRIKYRGLAGLSATSRIYAGWLGFDKDGAFVSTTGANALSPHSHAASAATPPVDGSWAIAEGFTQGHGSPNGNNGVAPSPQLPGVLHANVRYVLPIIILNYTGVAGDRMQVDRIEIEQTRYPANIIGRAQIANLAVDNAKINDASMDKITAGVLSAAVTISGRIATALTGARLELNSTGLKGYNAGGSLMVDIPNDGSGSTITGTFQTALTGARVRLSASSGVSQVELYSGITGETEPGRVISLVSGSGSTANASTSIVAPKKNGLSSASIDLFSRDANSGADITVNSYNGSVYWVSDSNYGVHRFMNTGGDTAQPWLLLARTQAGAGNTAGALIANGTGGVAINSIQMGGSIGSATMDLHAYQIRLYADSPDYAVKVIGNFDHSSGSLLMTNEFGEGRLKSLTSGGFGYLQSPVIYNRTGAAGGDVNVNSVGTLYRVTSARRYKVAIDYGTRYGDGSLIAALKSLRPVTFYDKAAAEQYAQVLERKANGEDVSDDELTVTNPLDLQVGLIAEDVAEAGMPELVQWGPDGQAEGLNYNRLAVALLPWLNALDRRLTTLESGT
jgi:hypothetical protein